MFHIECKYSVQVIKSIWYDPVAFVGEIAIPRLRLAGDMEQINFWNGNKSSARSKYEPTLLHACLNATAAEYGVASLHIDNTDYPRAEDESNIFDAGADILVTVAGNLKFEHKQKIMIAQPLARGLLGYRLLMVRDESLGRFRELKATAELQAFSIGIPETWADAGMFRHNGYSVVERGTFDDLIGLLKNRNFDYVALGANEIEEAFARRARPLGGISIEPTLMIYYPLPLVFYVNPRKPALARRVAAGLEVIMDSGEYDELFNSHHGNVVQRLQLKQRRIFTLQNPILPEEMAKNRSTLLD